MEKYFNDAIIGNKKITASYSNRGELLRLNYPEPNYKQFIDFFHTGVKVNDSNIIYLENDINNAYNQHYSKDTNVLKTKIKNTYFNLDIEQTDFAMLKENAIVKQYTFTNQNKVDLEITFLIHSKLLSDDNNFVGSKIIENGIIQYHHDTQFAIFAQNFKRNGHRLNDTNNYIESAILQDKDEIGMSNDSSVSYYIGKLKPQESCTLNIILYISETKEKNQLESIEKEIENLKKIDVNKEENKVKDYWRKYVKKHKLLKIKQTESDYYKKIDEIYTRTILLYPLLMNEQTGGIAAAIEIDEKQKHCGRYSYCWPRDAVFITRAMDILGMYKETEKFYKVFCKNTQNKDGMWEQRFYTDGKLAPCWGYQVDETASVIFGVYEHYIKTQDKKILKESLKMLEKASSFLQKYIEDIFTNSKKYKLSYDLWEMNEGIHLYSMASIFAAFECILKIYETVKEDYQENRLKLEQMSKQKLQIEKYLLDIKEYVIKNMYDTNRKVFKRNIEDNKMDISILGAVIPFKMFSAKEKKITNTVEAMNMTLRTYTGGYKRFEGDHYMNGKPWVIATLWMALYYIEINEYSKAKECFKYVVNTSAKHGFLAEQIDNDTMKPAWVIGLGWSHAMFIIVLEKLIENGNI